MNSESSVQFADFTRRDWQVAEEGTVRIAAVGAGWWTTEKALPAVESSDLCEATVLVSGSPERLDDVAAEWGIDHCLDYDAFHAGEAADAYDAVYVATPNGTHLEFVETAAGLGKSVLCEKPMEATVERAERLVEAAADVPLMIAYRMHTEPTARLARALVADGAIGEPVSVHGHMSQHLLSVIPDPDQWRLDPDLAGYGTTVMDIGVYPLNTTRFVLDADPVEAQATMASPDPEFESVPDEHVAFTLTFPDHVYATCTASMRATESSHLLIVGTEGEIRLEPGFFMEPTPTLRLRSAGSTVTYDPEPVDQMEEEFDYFADRILTDRPPTADGEHGLVDMRAMAAVYESGEAGRPVRIDSV